MTRSSTEPPPAHSHHSSTAGRRASPPAGRAGEAPPGGAAALDPAAPPPYNVRHAEGSGIKEKRRPLAGPRVDGPLRRALPHHGGFRHRLPPASPVRPGTGSRVHAHGPA